MILAILLIALGWGLAEMVRWFGQTETEEEEKKWKESGTQIGEEENSVVEGNRRSPSEYNYSAERDPDEPRITK